MTEFMTEDFMLHSRTARQLYHGYAETEPIVDYHCHISPRDIAENHRFSSITEAWLGGDHYKWRLMRACGIPERDVTGEESDLEKFTAYAKALSRAPGNPLYHWSHLELRRYFGCRQVLSEQTAPDIFHHCQEILECDDSLRVQGLLQKSRVRVLCTTDDPADDLHWHQVLHDSQFHSARVVPAMRPDRLMHIEGDDFSSYVEQLGESADMTIHTFADMCDALKRRMDVFAEMGCRAADHALDEVVYQPVPAASLERIFQKGLSHKTISSDEREQYLTGLLLFLAGEYRHRGWVMELHMGALRNVYTDMYRRFGADTGYDAIGRCCNIEKLARFLDHLEREGSLPKTILFSASPYDLMALTVLGASFPKEGIASRIQPGVPWWFNDTKQGLLDYLTIVSEETVLGNMVGMLTDSRSFLSYPRHEYFRRILCDWLGNLVECGEFPDDEAQLASLIHRLCYGNAISFFQFPCQ